MRFQRPSTERSAAFRKSALSFCEELLNRIEVRGIGRQVEQLCASGLDRFTYPWHLVSAEIIQHDNVAWLKGRRQDLFDIGEEGIAMVQ